MLRLISSGPYINRPYDPLVSPARPNHIYIANLTLPNKGRGKLGFNPMERVVVVYLGSTMVPRLGVSTPTFEVMRRRAKAVKIYHMTSERFGYVGFFDNLIRITLLRDVTGADHFALPASPSPPRSRNSGSRALSPAAAMNLAVGLGKSAALFSGAQPVRRKSNRLLFRKAARGRGVHKRKGIPRRAYEF
jgi:hypothetical protein